MKINEDKLRLALRLMHEASEQQGERSVRCVDTPEGKAMAHGYRMSQIAYANAWSWVRDAVADEDLL